MGSYKVYLSPVFKQEFWEGIVYCQDNINVPYAYKVYNISMQYLKNLRYSPTTPKLYESTAINKHVYRRILIEGNYHIYYCVIDEFNEVIVMYFKPSKIPCDNVLANDLIFL